MLRRTRIITSLFPRNAFSATTTGALIITSAIHTPQHRRLLIHKGAIKRICTQPQRKARKMTLESLPATFMRGGTSNGLVIHRRDLPSDPAQWQPILAAAMGSPDGYGRQLDGMGSGVSSTSKVCVVQKSRRAEADVDYTFVQVGIRDGGLELDGNCGNMASAIGPFALNEGLLSGRDVAFRGATEAAAAAAKAEHGEVTVRIFNTNTSKVILSTFRVTKDGVYDPSGDYSIDGVPGTASRITLSFIDPAGAKTGKALPTGHAVDAITLPDGTSIEASLVDIANPGVFVRADDLGIAGDISPADLEANPALLARLEQIRQEGTRMMGLNPKIQSIPKIVIVSRPNAEQLRDGVHIVCRALSMQQPHKAAPLTLALNLGTACRLAGTIPAMTAAKAEGQDSITIAHASGKLEVGAVFEDGRVKSALLHRTARVLMRGDVFYSAASE